MDKASGSQTADSDLSDLRRQARQLENEIDLKLVSFSKLGTSYTSQREYASTSPYYRYVQQKADSVHKSGAHDPKSDTVPLLNKTNSEHMFETMTMELEQLMAKLTEVNDRLAEYTQNFSLNSPSATLLHTLQRHRDILQNYSHEFQKTKANITALKERDDLLGSVHRDINAYKNSSGLNRRTDLYMKEHDHIRNSERLVDEQISVAMATKENLHLQKTFLNSITQTMNSFANRFPIVNSLIQRANIRKRRDSIILAAVIATCTILMILYAFH